MISEEIARRNESADSKESADSRPCSKCKVNQRSVNSSWCRPCRNEQAAEYRKRTRPPVKTEIRQCAWHECARDFEWSSKASRQVCCSKPCYGRYRWWRDNPLTHIPEGFILCSTCDSEKPLGDFPPSLREKKKAKCRDCAREYQKKWDRENRDRRSSASRRSKTRRLLRRYGAPSDEISDLVREQGGGCAICGVSEVESGRSFHIDHDHELPVEISYRGILCQSCNVGIGGFGDDPDKLLAAAEYVEKFNVRRQGTNQPVTSPEPKE